jgi:uncharacterized protein (UPF0333 family)
MDFRKFAKLIIGIGITIFIIGAWVYVNNQPLSTGNGLSYIINSVKNYGENVDRESGRTIATYTMICGGVISSFGSAMLFSSKKN